ncbi:hypothetical protein, partial [Streptomyces sp. wa1002]|uniref:hypothetical protein n=1 Tax=Streptomyces sp. wa1002 TaxID=1828186 RepID=UPI0011807E54
MDRDARRPLHGEPLFARDVAGPPNAGRAGEVLRVWRRRLDSERRTTVAHVNPVYDAEGFGVRWPAAGRPGA